MVAGACLGDPDIDATTRIASSPIVHGTSQLLYNGVVLDPEIWTVFNSQNTAFVRELAPAMFMLPFVGRYDDIFASMICQRIMREHDYRIHFGKPFTWQERNVHNLVDNLRDELFGMKHVEQFAQVLDDMPLSGKIAKGGCLGQMRAITDNLKSVFWFPPNTSAAMEAWCDDVEQVMSELPL